MANRLDFTLWRLQLRGEYAMRKFVWAAIAAAGGPWIQTVATPLPGALPLFATGLGALGLLGSRREQKAVTLAA
jgi:hypothetical protein